MSKNRKNTQPASNDANVAQTLDQTPDQTPETPDQTPETPDQTPTLKSKMTKKSIVILHLDMDGGDSINNIAQAIVDLGLDPDLDKNKRVTRLWISKIGFKVDKKEGKYFRAK